MAEYATVSLKAYFTLGWSDITQYIVGPIKGEWGIQGQTPIDRIADTGTLTFTVRNDQNFFTPGSIFSFAGWGKGTKIAFDLIYDGITYRRFYGLIETINIASGTFGKRTCTVTAVDWFDHAAEALLDTLALQQNKRSDEAITSILSVAGIQPVATNLDVGEVIFPVIFDTLDGRTRVYTELSKIVRSELGYLYIRKSRTTGETLTFENATHRNGLSALSTIPVAAIDAFLMKEDGDFLLAESGDILAIDAIETALFDNSMMNLDVVYGQDLTNKVRVEVYPKRQDTAIQTLFKLDSPMQLAPSGIDVIFEGRFKDPAGGNTNVTGINMIAPVVNTDYKMWTNSDGTGTDITTSLIITATYKADKVIYTVRNSNALSGYITLLQARGYGIYSYNPIQYVASNAESIASHGEYEVLLSQQYQTDLAQGIVAGKSFLNEYKNPRTVINAMTCNANYSGRLMEAFLNLDIGDLIRVKETQTNVDRWAWIQNIAFEVTPDGVIFFTYGLKEHYSLASGGLRLLSFDPQPATKGAIDFGYLPRCSNLVKRTYTAWIYATDASGSDVSTIFAAPNSDYGGGFIRLHDTDVNGVALPPGVKIFSFYYRYSDNAVAYFVSVFPGSITIPANAWTFIACSRDDTIPTLTAPKMYINGTECAVVKWATTTPTGVIRNETGASFCIGNRKSATTDYDRPFVGGLKDLRLYNRVLTASEIATIYNAGAGGVSVSDGLIFQGPVCYKSKEAEYNGAILTTDKKLLDNIHGAVGEPIASVRTHLI